MRSSSLVGCSLQLTRFPYLLGILGRTELSFSRPGSCNGQAGLLDPNSAAIWDPELDNNSLIFNSELDNNAMIFNL